MVNPKPDGVIHEFLLRPAEESDADLLFYWVNQADSISNMLSRNNPIKWRDHLDWFSSRLSGSDSMIWIVVKDDEAIGQIRLELNGNALEVSIYVERRHRRSGIGRRVLEHVCQEAADRWPGLTLRARIKLENRASQELFMGVGFRKTAQEVNHLVFERTI